MKRTQDNERGFRAAGFRAVRAAGMPLFAAVLLSTLSSTATRADALSEAAGRYRIEPSSQIAFHVAQAGGGGISGRFDKFAGTFTLDRNIGRSTVELVIFPESVHAGEQRVENFLRSDAVFDVENSREIVFRSTRVTQTGPTTARLDGRLTARGKTRTESFEVTLSGRDRHSIAFHVTGRIMRSPYGMSVGTPIYSNVVEFDMMLRGRKQ